jgi:MoaA/NifB/PqqE/SkfB family radical SAM enzyme
MVQDNRPAEYNYIQILKNHIGSWDKIYNGELIYPRQLEIHLPGNHKIGCNFNCYYCQGRILQRPLDMNEEYVYSIIEQLKGAIPFHIYGGAYTEPLLNPWLLKFLKLTKKYGSKFGIHTNGSLLLQLQQSIKFMDELCAVATSPEDYLSISIDAGSPDSHMKSKNIRKNWFDEIIAAVDLLCKIRGGRKIPAIRFSYIMNEYNSSRDELFNIVKIARDIGIDSVRFSVPYDVYGKPFEQVREYKEKVEVPFDIGVRARLDGLLSQPGDNPFVFYIPPTYQDVDKMHFKQCIYNYYQITFASDGYMYNCSSTASPSFKSNRLGKQTDNINDFNRMVLKSHNPKFDSSVCFRNGARCNRMGLDINLAWENLNA